MRKLYPISLLILAAVVMLSFVQAPAAAGPVDVAKQFVDQMAKGDFAAATSHFDATVKAAAPPQALQQAWQAVTAQTGEFKRQAGTRSEKFGGFDLVYVRCEFGNGPMDIQVAFSQAGEIGGFHFVQSKDASEYQQGQSQAAPPPPKPAGLRELEVKVGSGEWTLPGTLTLPEGDGPFPAVVLVHGSGPNDRDETLLSNKPFRDLAYGLAKRGVAVLRYDKRTMVYPSKMAAMTDLTPKQETTDDALAAAYLLRKTQGIDPKRVFVLGHSLGGMLIPRIGLADPKLAGLIVMAGTARPLEDVIVEQTRYLASLNPKLSPEAKAQIEKIREQAARVKTLTESSGPILGVPAKYWLDLRGYNPPQTAAQLKQPLLILQGGRDYQVTMDDFQLWKQTLASKDGVTFITYPTLNHLFMAGTGKPGPDEYRIPSHVAEVVIDDIAGWVKGH